MTHLDRLWCVYLENSLTDFSDSTFSVFLLASLSHTQAQTHIQIFIINFQLTQMLPMKVNQSILVYQLQSLQPSVAVTTGFSCSLD